MHNPSVQRNVIAIAYSFPPSRGSGSIRNRKFISGLAHLGWDTRVLTVKERYFTEGEGYGLMEGIPKNVDVIRTRCFYTQKFVVGLKDFLLSRGGEKQVASSENSHHYKKMPGDIRAKSSAQKLKDFITDVVTIPDKEVGWLPFGLFAGIKSLRRKKANVLYAVGKPWTVFFIGYFLKLIYKIPLVIDFRDPWTQNSFNVSKGKLLDKVELFLEKFIVRQADYVIANTEELRKDFVERLNAPKWKVHVLTGGYDEKDFPLRFNFAKKANGRFIITHIGTFYGERNPVNFLKAIKRLIENKLIPRDVLRVNFIGSLMVSDPEAPSLLKELSAAKVLHQESWAPHRKAIERLYASDVLLLVQTNTYLQIPAKLYEYIFARKPILAICEENGATDNMIKREDWGKSIQNDVDQISNAIYELYSRYQAGELSNYISEKRIQSYSISKLSSKLERILAEAGKKMLADCNENPIS